MTAAEQRARAVLERLPKGPVEGAEVGVFDGRMSEQLLRLRDDLTLHMVDRWKPGGRRYRDTGDPLARLGPEEMQGARKVAERRTRFAAERRTVHETSSRDAAVVVPPLDFAFIDAEHSYEAVTADIGRWVGTLKPGGLLCGHDYGDPSYPGVQRAVDEACSRHDWKPETGANLTWFVWP